MVFFNGDKVLPAGKGSAYRKEGGFSNRAGERERPLVARMTKNTPKHKCLCLVGFHLETHPATA